LVVGVGLELVLVWDRDCACDILPCIHTYMDWWWD
jgi:hypothetical protein